jgi:hypothetical protein
MIHESLKCGSFKFWRVALEWDRYPLLRVWRQYMEVAYVAFRIQGLCLQIEFQSDWHETPRVWVRIGLGFCMIAFSFKWSGALPDDQGQCSGPEYGFAFYDDVLTFYHGKATGRPRDGSTTRITMPWAWTHVRHSYLKVDGSRHHNAALGEYSAPAVTKSMFPYIYVRQSGEIQHREATVNGEEREWRLHYTPWLPWPRKIRRSINVEFSEEVGERAGSWKGGCLGCGYDWLLGETQLDALRRMERDREFNR